MNRTIRTYDELIQYVRAFAEKESQRVMVVIGAPGLSKSTVLQSATTDATWLRGILSPWILYRSLHDLPDESSCVVIDDVDRFFKEKDGVSVLKQVCDTSEVRTVMWNRANSEIRSGDVQASFETKARVCLICNELSRQNENVLAVHNRGYVINFKPDAEEVHRYVGQWFKDEIVYEFVGEWLKFIDAPSCRDYVIASNAREAGLNWQRDLLETWGVDDEIITVSKLLSEHFGTERERVQAYKDRTGKSQADYYRRAATLKAGEVEKLDLSTSQLLKNPRVRLLLSLMGQRLKMEKLRNSTYQLLRIQESFLSFRSSVYSLVRLILYLLTMGQANDPRSIAYSRNRKLVSLSLTLTVERS